MYDDAEPQNAVAAIRVSTTKQGTDGDSPEAQREQIQQFAAARNITIKKVFLFLESASKEQQPVQEAIDYCKQRKHHIQLFIVKSIDRFTRGGSYSYSSLKMQLDKAGVRLMDIYGIIGTHKVNTLEHLGVSYPWSVYDPTKNSELLEAERAHDEKRDIMSRMIGAQVRYTRLGYIMRRPPMGYRTVTAETLNGKRCLLEPDPIESHWVITMFELRARGTMTDRQIVDVVNSLGFKTRLMYSRDKHDRGRITGRKGGRLLTVKLFQQYIRSPIYAGILVEKWTLGRAVKSKSPSLISIETFNKANRGKLSIIETGGELIIRVRIPDAKGDQDPPFPIPPRSRLLYLWPATHRQLQPRQSR
jgi:site-specific DNA recombinase